MEENKQENVETKQDDGSEGTTPTETTKHEDATKETVTMSKEDFDKALQSAEDKVRGKLSKTIRELEERVKTLAPEEKTQEQMELEKRIAALEASEREVQSQKQRLDIQERLCDKGIDKSLVDYLKDNIDVEAVSNIIEGVVKSRMKSTGYVPGDHGSDEKVTLEDYRKMKYFEKEKFSKEHPEAYKRLVGRK